MRLVPLTLVFALTVPAVARGEPIPVALTTSGGFSHEGGSVAAGIMDLGTLVMPSVNSVGTFLIAGWRTNTDFVVSFMLEGLGRFDTLKLEVLNPLGTNDQGDPEQPSYMPAGYSSSNNLDALSFAQDSGLKRSAVFAGGSASVIADEYTHHGDILLFSGLSGAESARVLFGLRDGLRVAGGSSGGFLLRISAADAVATPEPASMLLLGTGLAGLVAARRRRAATAQ